MKRRRSPIPFRGSGGSILLEVLLATVLVGLLVVPLATALADAVDQARDARQRTEGARGGGTAARSSRGWEWGPRVIAGWWRPGPVLHLRVSGIRGESSGDTVVGLWADGWLIAVEAFTVADESVAASIDELQVGPELWSGLAESELVVRMRTSGGVWGPPWRLAVPGPPGETPALGCASSASPESPTVVVHRPGLGTSSLTATWSPGALSSPPFSLVFLLTPAIEGWSGATLDERSQWWWMGKGRSVDLYF